MGLCYHWPYRLSGLHAVFVGGAVTFPEATHLSRSWVVSNKSQSVVVEIFSEKLARKYFDAGFKVVLIGDHLASLNSDQ